MATVNPATAVQKKIDVSIKDGKSFSENVFFLELWSVGNTNSEKTIEVKGGQNISGTFKQIQFAFEKNHNYIFTKFDLNQKGLDEKYRGSASEFTISGLSAGNASTVIRIGKTNSASDFSEKHNGPAELVEVKVEQPKPVEPTEKDSWTSKGVLDIGKTFRTSGDEFCPWDKRLYFPKTAQKPDNQIDGKGNIILSGEGSSRFFIMGKWKNMRMECDLVPTNLMDNMSLNGRSGHNIDCKFGGYHLTFGIDDNEDMYGKKEGGPGYSHGIYSPRLGINRDKFESGVGSLQAGKKVRLALEVRDDGSKVRVKGFVDKLDGKGFVQSHEYIDDGHCFDDKEWNQEDLDALKECDVKPEDINKPYLKEGNMVWFRANHHEEDEQIRIDNPRIKDIQVSNIVVREI